ncbi:hypothetical protein [Neotabrizicola sp. VNH66]|uniref:hypothetical protein n=1 Tax=Neotabrizicola sp. VNH66 TaxID=3400918 RepID=UPI003C0CB2B9
MIRRNRLTPASLLGLTLLSACAGVETGAVSPCHGQFRAEGKYFAAREQTDGSTVVVSTMNAPDARCGN